MNRNQANDLVRQTFAQAFDKVRFHNFTLNLLNRLDESKAFTRNSQYVKEAFRGHVQSFERLGTYTSPENEKLDVLIVHLTHESKLERARTAIRNFVADHLKTRDEKDAALVAFVSPSEKTWRFSYVKMEYATVEKDAGKVGVEARLTPARRFSYIVGEGESCHTAQTRFLDLLQDTEKDPALAHLEEAFSVEAVTKEFYTRYAELFGKIHEELEKLVAKDETLREEFTARGVNTVDFAKKLMGQIVFLYFLQKKGWLGVARGRDWGSGPRDFLRRLAKGEYGKYSNFFNDILEPLFYDTLATDRGHEAWCNRFECRIPFLNGGLFEPPGDYDWRKTDIILPNRLFTNSEFVEEGITGTGVLDVFDRYNFTVNEAEPLEREVAIDPEMLGKVFENLIEDNRRKGLGAYYTPREIVHYMCQESLINYLDTALNQTSVIASEAKQSPRRDVEIASSQKTLLAMTGAGPAYEEVVPRADIETFVHLGEQISHYEAVETAYRIRMPKSIEPHARLIDEKLAEITICDPAVGSGAFPVGMMTEIVRARSALTPYFNDVHERTPYHFKRHAIQNCLYGVDIDPGAVEIAKLRLWLSLVVDEEDVKQIKPLPNLDYKIVPGNSLLGVEKNLFNVHLFNRLEDLKPLYFDESDKTKKDKYRRDIDDLIHRLTNGKQTFDFEIYFSEVFHRKDGFDVVIANPPYISVEKFARTAEQSLWKERFKKTYAARGDVYCFFFQRGIELLRDHGKLTFITSNKFMRADYGKGLREMLGTKTLHTVIDFGELPVFAASTDPSIVVLSKTPPPKTAATLVAVIKSEADIYRLLPALVERGESILQADLKSEGWTLEGSAGLKLIEKLRKKGAPLGGYVNGRFYYGIKTGFNEAFVIDRATRNQLVWDDPDCDELIRPWLDGHEILRWRCNFTDQYLLTIPSSGNRTMPWSTAPTESKAEAIFSRTYPSIYEHLHAFKSDLVRRSDQGKYWWELRACSYWHEFTGVKIIFNETSKELHAFVDREGFIVNKTGSILLPRDPLFVLAVLNSSTLDYLFRATFPSWGDPWAEGRVQFRGALMKQAPIPSADAAQRKQLEKLSEACENAAMTGDAAAVRKHEREIDRLVYKLYDLTPEEIAIVEGVRP